MRLYTHTHTHTGELNKIKEGGRRESSFFKIDENQSYTDCCVDGANKGITLIALVVTIIVLLILAGVTINLVVGQNGIITRANEAKEEQRGASVEEQVSIWRLDKEAEKYMPTGNVETQAGLIERLYKDKLLTKEEYDSLVANPNQAITIGSKQINFTDETKDEIEDNTPNEDTSKVEVDKPVTKDSTINGEPGAYNNPIIPKGFKAIETAQDSTITAEASWTSPTGWQNGLVIEDATGDSTTQGSQFVWIPVENYNNFHLIEGYHYNGDLQVFISSIYPSREAGASKTEKVPGKPSMENSLLGTEESVAMYKSVRDNGGFYVGRYEMGVLGTTASTTTNDSNKQIQDGSVKPVSKKGVGVWNYILWGGSTAKEATDGEAGNDRANGSVKVARKMYNNPIEGNYNNNTSVKSTLIYGVQWDAIMNFIDNSYITGNCSYNSFIKNSEGKGNFLDYITTTGSREEYKQKNIYDLAGNVTEWTMETELDTYARIGRGGTLPIGYKHSASRRTDSHPGDTVYYLGTRISLYL